jgi:rubrerythrin
MARAGSNEQLCNLAIAAEKKMEELYAGLMEKFRYSEVSKWFNALARDEIAHGRTLGAIRDSMKSEQLFAEANPDLINEASKYTKISIADKLDSIETIEDAYNTIYELEYSTEINVLYSFLLSESITTEQKQKRLKQLKSHLKKIDDFPSKFLNVP